MLTFFHATVETGLTTTEIIARIRNHTFEADPYKWRHYAVGDNRWVGHVTSESLMLRRPYMSEGFAHPRLAGFYREVGFDGKVTDTGAARTILFTARFRPARGLGYLLLLTFSIAICLLAIIAGDATGRLTGMLFLGILAFAARFMWWGFKACARDELQYLQHLIDGAGKEAPADRH